MNKYYILIIIIFLSNNEQICQFNKFDLIGDWIKYKAERLDGSKIIDRIGTDTTFLEFSFSTNEFSFQYHPAKMKKGIEYYLKNNIINVGLLNSYKIEKLANDTLIISDQSNSQSNHKLNRYYFVRKAVLAKKAPVKLENNIPVFNDFTFPRVNKVFDNYLQTCNSDNSKSFRLKGSLIFNHKEKKLKANLEFLDNVEKVRMQTIKVCIENTYQYWDFNGLPHYPISKIYFIAKSNSDSDYLKFIFCSNDLNDFNLFNNINFKHLKKI